MYVEVRKEECIVMKEGCKKKCEGGMINKLKTKTKNQKII